jgi:uncharacterized protein YdaU (DUF1376 family)
MARGFIVSSFPHLPLFTDAFIADTGHLSAQETGAYLMLLMMAWRVPECRLPDNDDKLARWARVDRRTWLRIKPTVMEFWTLAEGFWVQKRLSKERDVVSKRAEVARKNGEQGGRPKSLENNNSANPAGSSRVTQQKAPIPIPIPIPIPTASLRSAEREIPRKHAWPADYRDQIWIAYGKPVEKKAGMQALDNLHRSDSVDFTELIEGVRRQAAEVPDPQFRPSLERFIKREKWTDQPVPKAPQNGSAPHDLFSGRTTGGRRDGAGVDPFAAGLARVAAHRGIGPGSRQNGGGSEDARGNRTRPDDPEIEDAHWSPAGGYSAAHH